jgi:predicted ATPase/transcriptional regulator with XRE-family HTH domain
MGQQSQPNFGVWLRQRRTELGVTRAELAERVGFSFDLLRKLESGLRRPSGQIANLIADYFHVPADEREAFVTFARSGRTLVTTAAPSSSDADDTPSTSSGLTPWRHTYIQRTNLPAMLTPLIGRTEDVAEIRQQLLHPKTHLLTLTGAPGIGKTRLALQIASQVVEQFDDGVYLVELAPVVDPDLVPQIIAGVLGIKESNDRPLATLVEHFLRERRILIVLDNFEQILDAAPFVVKLLEGSPWLKVMVTSREPLHAKGERRFAVPPLQLPVSSQVPSPQHLLIYPSIELFVERSRMTQPDFALTVQNAGAVVRICIALDGLPLAIELAAGQSGFLSPEEIEGRLGSRLLLLKTKARGLPDRQRTLHGAIEWSYNLLSASEQAVFRRLGVFAGGYTFEAAGAVSMADDHDEGVVNVVEALGSLLEKNLITRGMPTKERGASSTDKAVGRFGMLETLREYALAQLVANGEEEETRDRHARYYLAFVQEGGEHFVGIDAIGWVARVEAEYNNMREALAWLTRDQERKETVGQGRESAASKRADEAGGRVLKRIELGASLCTALYPFWEKQNHLSDARSWYMRAAERLAALVGAEKNGDDDRAVVTGASNQPPELPALWARMLTGAGAMAYYQGDFDEARALNERGLAIRREIGDTYGVASCLNNLGVAATDQGDYLAARGYLSETLDIARALGISWKTCAALRNLGIVETRLGNFAEARVLLEESLDLGRSAVLVGGIADALTSLGVVARFQGDYWGARRFLKEALDSYRQVDHKAGSAEVLVQLGCVALDSSDHREARLLFSEALSIWTQMEKKSLIADCLEGMASVCGKEGQAERAGRLFGAAERIREVSGIPLSPSEWQYYEHQLAAVRGQLDDERWSAAWAKGRAMEVDQVIADALEPEMLQLPG